MTIDSVPDAPTTTTILADPDGHSRWLAHLSGYDILEAGDKGGIYLLVTMDNEGNLQVATKPGNAWDCTWSPPVPLERK
jgi:hypothetical protein